MLPVQSWSRQESTGVLNYRLWSYALPDDCEIGVILPGNIFDSEFMRFLLVGNKKKNIEINIKAFHIREYA